MGLRGPKPGSKRGPGTGRKKGTPNKRSVLASDIFKKLKYDPLDSLIKLAKSKKLPKDLQIRVDQELCGYLWPKRKAIEITGQDGGPISVKWLDE